MRLTQYHSQQIKRKGITHYFWRLSISINPTVLARFIFQILLLLFLRILSCFCFHNAQQTEGESATEEACRTPEPAGKPRCKVSP